MELYGLEKLGHLKLLQKSRMFFLNGPSITDYKTIPKGKKRYKRTRLFRMGNNSLQTYGDAKARQQVN